MYSAKIIADSIPEAADFLRTRLTTMELTFPRMVHSEYLTHRVFSRNAASSRAIPIKKMIDAVIADPVIPVYWGRNQAGMQAQTVLTEGEREKAVTTWLKARDSAVASALTMEAQGVHKQIVNRILEPWIWITVIASATKWENFFNQRCHKDAQPEIGHIAKMARPIYDAGIPDELSYEDYHLPYYSDDLAHLCKDDIAKCCIARCARVSYLNHDGRKDHVKDLELFDKLVFGFHMSPLEHVAQWDEYSEEISNFGYPWDQYRKNIKGEDCFKG